MKVYEIIEKFYKPNTESFKILVTHGEQVAKKALEIARKNPALNLDFKFIQEAAMLHDIGIYCTDAKNIGCNGNLPYICHGDIGRQIMEKLKYPKHALVCERHIGTGITLEEIKKNSLPIPLHDMLPETLEEKLICYADKFYSKTPEFLIKEKSIEKIIHELQKFGNEQVTRFYDFIKLFQ